MNLDSPKLTTPLEAPMSDGTQTPDSDKNETEVEETPKKEGLNPLWIVAALGLLMFVLLGGMWMFGGPTGTDAVAKAPVVEAPATPGETPVAETVTPGPVTVAASADTRLAPVEIRRQDYLCAVLVFDQAVIEGVGSDDLKWGTKSSKERWELCGVDLKKEDPDQHGARALTVGGKRVKLSELIATRGGEYVSLASTPGALARCWGEGQVNADGQPACSSKPQVVAQAAPVVAK